MVDKSVLKQQMRAVGADLARAGDRITRGDALGATERLYDGLRRLAGAVGLVIDAEAPKAAEAPQDVLQEPAPVAIVTDDQVREFAGTRRWREPAAFEMLMNAANTIEHLSGLVCQQTKVLRAAQQEIADLKQKPTSPGPPCAD